MKNNPSKAAVSVGKFVIKHRHDIADALILIATVLKLWPDNQEFLPDLRTRKKAKA